MPSLVLERATAESDAEIRSLLRRTPMDGDIRVTFEREPELALSNAVEGDRHHTFVARDTEGHVRGVCSRSVRRVWFNGTQARIGYLGQLRCELPLRGSIRPLIEGFDACSATREPDELPFDLTSIMADNSVARRILERGFHGLPRYVPLTTFKTMLIPATKRLRHASSGERIERGSRGTAAAIAAFLQSQYQRFQFAAVWTEEDLLSDSVTRGLRPEDFVIAMRDGQIAGCAALWDQSRFKQTVVRGYASPLGALRPLVNLWMRITGQPLLPAVGSPVRYRTISHVAVEDDDPKIALTLLNAIFATPVTAPFDYYVLGFAAGHPLCRALEESLKTRVLSSILYTVHDHDSQSVGLDGRTTHVEVATL